MKNVVHVNIQLFIYQVKKTADNIDEAAKELPDANLVR